LETKRKRMISQFFVLSQRGDTLVLRDYRGDIVRGTPEIFFRKLKAWKGEDFPPVFNIDGIQFIFITTQNLYFVCTTKFNVSPILVLELLHRLAVVFKDYCGILSEESLRFNFGLIYELLDETLDYGYPQVTSSDVLKSFIHDKPAPLKDANEGIIKQLGNFGKVHQPSTATNKPITLGFSETRSAKNEIFVDLLERLTVLFNASGEVLKTEVDGSIQMKSYLSGSPEIKLGLSKEIVIGKANRYMSGHGVAQLDDCNFHECVNMDEFEKTKVISFSPPDGEFILMNYRSSGDYPTPFRVFPFLEEVSGTRLDLVLRVRADIAQNLFGNNLIFRIPVPKSTTSCSAELAASAVGHNFEFKAADKQAVWKIKKFSGGTEESIRIKMMVSNSQSNAIKKEVGPVSIDFEVANLTSTGISISFLKVYERSKSYTPYRWVRLITYSNSYVCRV